MPSAHPPWAFPALSALLVLANLLGSSSIALAEVWEFDRRGTATRTPDPGASRMAPAGPEALGASASSKARAVYQPMAEGVAEVYAADPAVAAAGLAEEDFVRVFVALIDQESRFDPHALSPKGARGLGQLMPETAALLGVDDPSEPMENLHGAARYLTAQLAEFGRVDWALAAYNAGPGRVAQFHGIPPFRETRDYVAKITAAADVGGAAVEPDIARAASAPPRPEAVRALTTALEPAGPEPTPLQGTVLEWKR